MASNLFLRLIQKIVTEDGAGHRELEKRVVNGEITKEEQALIILRANGIILNNKVRNLIEKVDAFVV